MDEKITKAIQILDTLEVKGVENMAKVVGIYQLLNGCKESENDGNQLQ